MQSPSSSSFYLLLISIAYLLSDANAYEYPVPATRVEYGAPPDDSAISQYHTQDEHGQYSYGFTSPLHSKHETRTADGVTHGSYSYVDADGKIQTVQYTADAGGFRVSATNLPHQTVAETPEVAALRAQHLAAHEEVKQGLANGNLPTPVQDTPEVAAAKVAFFKRFEAEKLRNKMLSAQQQQVSRLPSSHIIYSHPLFVKSVPVMGFVYNFNKGTKGVTQLPSRDYLPAN